MRKITAYLAITLLTILSTPANADDPKVYELRTYTTNVGKLDDLHARFRDHTIRIFEKHGMKSMGYWTPADTPNTLTYLLQHENSGTIEQSWKAFVDDPEWQKVYADSIANGRLIANIESTFMSATDYSEMK